MLYATGKRKSAIAKVRLSEVSGNGSITINGINHSSYFHRDSLSDRVDAPFRLANLDSSRFSLIIDVIGGGLMGQSEAIRHGISKILSKICDPESKKSLRDAGFITRDSRVVESKKAGFKKARKKPQFSKR